MTTGVAPGQLEQETIYAAGSQTAYETITYQYHANEDSKGDYHDIVSSTTGVGTTTTDSEYDVNGNLIQITTTEPAASNVKNTQIDYTYNLATGEETGVSTGDTSIQYGYDQAGELTSVTVNELNDQPVAPSLVTSYTYNSDGDLSTTQNANGTTESRDYNSLGRLMSIVDFNASGIYAQFDYTYDSDGNVLTETDISGRTDTYTYDGLGRVTREVISDPQAGSRTLTWSYDLVGNRVASTDTGALPDQKSLSYVYNANDELLSITGISGYAQSFSYDYDGNTMTVTGSGGASSAGYTWDPLGRMSGFTSGSTAVSYTYDGIGDRTAETVNGQTTTYLNDPTQASDQVLEEYAPGGILAVTYIRGIDLLFQDRIQSGSGTLSFYATDNQGSTRALTNSAGSVTDTYAYDAFGDLIGGTQVTTNEFMFTGEQFDEAIGQYYQRARYYDTSEGRFTSRDSYDGQTDDPITENRYIYANADPVNVVDPSGHDGEGLVEALTSISISISISVIQISAAHPILTFLFISAVSATGVFDGFPPGDPTPFDELAAWGRILKQAPQGVQELTAFEKYVGSLLKKAFFSVSTSNQYRETFFEAFPYLRGLVWVHHAIEQQVLKRYPGVITQSELNSLANLRGIPNEINSDVHLSQIRILWNNFYNTHATATKQQLLDYATQIDNMFGSQFNPPIR